MTLSDIASFWDRHPACTLQPGRTALVLDSPHSGTLYPPDFRFACPAPALRMAEDTDVDALWGFAPSLGVALLQAHFPRSYIDANRALDELDASMLSGAWPAALADSPKVRLGKGLIWRLLDEAIAGARRAHGVVIHIDCHSMPSVAQAYSTEHPYQAHPDFVLGDRDGTTASPELTRRIERFLNSRGYTVGVNHPYKGVEIVRRHGRPAEGCHSIQLEINKRLYMDETTLERRPEFERVQRTLRELVERLIDMKLER